MARKWSGQWHEILSNLITKIARLNALECAVRSE